MDIALEMWKRGEYPGHHLWGTTHLHEHGIDVDILAHELFSFLNTKRTKKWGNLDQQLRIFFKQARYDLIYSACQTNTYTLALLRINKFFRTPLVAFVINPLPYSKRNVKFVTGHDRLLCLNESLKRELEKDYKSLVDGKLDLPHWGPDLNFYGNVDFDIDLKNNLFISAGKANRDYNTLLRAFEEIDCQLEVYCSPDSMPSAAARSKNVRIISGNAKSAAIPYKGLLEVYRKSRGILIPIDSNTKGASGTTSLFDAMAMGKPVVITHNVDLGLDVEREGIGLWADPGDHESWQRAVTFLTQNPDKAAEMGRRGRALCESKYNLRSFTARLALSFKEVVS